LLILKIFRHA